MRRNTGRQCGSSASRLRPRIHPPWGSRAIAASPWIGFPRPWGKRIRSRSQSPGWSFAGRFHSSTGEIPCGFQRAIGCSAAASVPRSHRSWGPLNPHFLLQRHHSRRQVLKLQFIVHRKVFLARKIVLEDQRRALPPRHARPLAVVLPLSLPPSPAAGYLPAGD